MPAVFDELCDDLLHSFWVSYMDVLLLKLCHLQWKKIRSFILLKSFSSFCTANPLQTK